MWMILWHLLLQRNVAKIQLIRPIAQIVLYMFKKKNYNHLNSGKSSYLKKQNIGWGCSSRFGEGVWVFMYAMTQSMGSYPFNKCIPYVTKLCTIFVKRC